MIYVTQGHELSVSLEIFLKSILLLSPQQTKKICLVANKETLEKQLKILSFDFQFKDDSLFVYEHKIALIFTKRTVGVTESQASLDGALSLCKKGDILLTLPTSKDQLISKGGIAAGHTEYFRSLYENNNLCMVFKDDIDFHLLLTDHVPLDQVTQICSASFILKKVLITLDGLTRFFIKPKKVFFAGINPHAGEDGILGNDQEIYREVFSLLKQSSNAIDFIGPLSGDTLHNISSKDKAKLFVYPQHDQALAPFKLKNRFWGSNMTLGLPFLRLSVDHGTAFDLYGKNKANPMGCFDNLVTALKIHG